MLQKLAIANISSEKPFINIQDHFNLTRVQRMSQVAYLEAMDAIHLSDSKATLLKLLHDLFANFIKNQTREHLEIEGD